VVDAAKTGGAGRMASEAARNLAALRRQHTKICPVCSREFIGLASKIYDRPACQTKAYRRRRRDRSGPGP
jgi:hypothetical protein